jgi:predicted XRE-type DNA-binding protein
LVGKITTQLCGVNNGFKKIIKHITPVDGNIFADLGFESEEALKLKDMLDSAIRQNLSIRNALISELAGWFEVQGLNQAEAARILGITSSRVAEIISVKETEFTIDALIDMLLRIGKRVRVSVE